MPEPIQAISALRATDGVGSIGRAGGVTPAAKSSFGDVFGQALDDLSRLSNHSDGLAEAFAAGEDVEIHEVMIAMQETQMAFDFATQVRGKVIDAYQEIMRMQV